MLAFLLLVCSPGTEKELAEEMQTYEEIVEAFVVYGEYDLLGKVDVPDLKKLNEFITEIRQYKHIQMTHTLIVMGE